jgi:hypothetical protein
VRIGKSGNVRRSFAVVMGFRLDDVGNRDFTVFNSGDLRDRNANVGFFFRRRNNRGFGGVGRSGGVVRNIGSFSRRSGNVSGGVLVFFFSFSGRSPSGLGGVGRVRRSPGADGRSAGGGRSPGVGGLSGRTDPGGLGDEFFFSLSRRNPSRLSGNGGDRRSPGAGGLSGRSDPGGLGHEFFFSLSGSGKDGNGSFSWGGGDVDGFSGSRGGGHVDGGLRRSGVDGFSAARGSDNDNGRILMFFFSFSGRNPSGLSGDGGVRRSPGAGGLSGRSDPGGLGDEFFFSLSGRGKDGNRSFNGVSISSGGGGVVGDVGSFSWGAGDVDSFSGSRWGGHMDGGLRRSGVNGFSAARGSDNDNGRTLMFFFSFSGRIPGGLSGRSDPGGLGDEFLFSLSRGGLDNRNCGGDSGGAAIGGGDDLSNMSRAAGSGGNVNSLSMATGSGDMDSCFSRGDGNISVTATGSGYRDDWGGFRAILLKISLKLIGFVFEDFEKVLEIVELILELGQIVLDVLSEADVGASITSLSWCDGLVFTSKSNS